MVSEVLPVLKLGNSKREKRKTAFICLFVVSYFVKFIPKTQKYLLCGGKVCLPMHTSFLCSRLGAAMSDS